MKDKVSKTNRLKLWGNIVAFVAALMAIISFCSPDDLRSAPLITSLLIISIAIPILLNTPFSEFNFFGFGMKVLNGIDVIQKRQIFNQSLMFSQKGENTRWFWMDEFGKMHEVPDRETALFLAKERGIIEIDEKQLSSSQLMKSYPSLKDAKPKHYGGRDFFLQYNGISYYQSSLSWIFWLAAQNNVTFLEKKELIEWELNGVTWIEEINKEDLDVVG